MYYGDFGFLKNRRVDRRLLDSLGENGVELLPGLGDYITAGGDEEAGFCALNTKEEIQP